MRRVGWVALAIVAMAAASWAVEQVRVVEREARVRADKRKFGAALVVVAEGETIDLVASEPPWLRVRHGKVEGWLHESAVTRGGPSVVSTSGLVSTDIEASERSAAQKGFDASTETAYRASKPELAAAYLEVDAIDAARPDEAAIAVFLAKGQLEGGSR